MQSTSRLMFNFCVMCTCRCTAAGASNAKQTAQPWQLHSFPATPIHALNPAAAPAGHLPVWFDLQVLAFYSRARLEVQSLSDQAFVSLLLAQHHLNGCTAISDGGQLQPDTLRKQLATTATQYQLVEHRRQEAVRAAAQAQQPGAALQPDCIACADQPHSLYADGNMKQTHLRQAATASQRQPQIQRHLLPNQQVEEFMRGPGSDIGAPLPDSCNGGFFLRGCCSWPHVAEVRHLRYFV